MRALDPEVFDAVWTAVRTSFPSRPKTHPLGCHRHRVSDRLCFVGDPDPAGHRVLVDQCRSDPRVPGLRHHACGPGATSGSVAGSSTPCGTTPCGAYDRIIGLDLSEVALDGSLHKAPCGGEGTGKNPTDRGKLGWKWSIATEAKGIPIGWAIDGANRNDVKLLGPTLEDVGPSADSLEEIETVHLDRGYDYPKIRTQLREVRTRATSTSSPDQAGRRHDGEQATPPRIALGGRKHQLVAVQLRPAPPQHRPANRGTATHSSAWSPPC